MSSPLSKTSGAPRTVDSGGSDVSSDPMNALRVAEDAVLRLTGIPIERLDIEVDSNRLHYLCCGSGEPLLLLHERGWAGATFAPILPMVSEQRQALTLDLPGWGLSDKPIFTGHSPKAALNVWMNGVLGFLDALGIDQIDLLGHSMGGFAALGLALEHPGRVRRLILVDPAGIGTDMSMDSRLYFGIGPEKLHRRLGRLFTRFILSMGGGSVHNELDEPMFDLYHALLTQADVIPSGARAFHTWINLFGIHLTLAHRLHELEMPVLMLWGDSDSLNPYDTGLHSIRSLRDGQLVAFTHTGHSPFAERPDDFAAILLSWLNGVYVRSRV
ncbi:MAG: alpha/beta fold hydrolase [Ktedonobacterales bacterium]